MWKFSLLQFVHTSESEKSDESPLPTFVREPRSTWMDGNEVSEDIKNTNRSKDAVVVSVSSLHGAGQSGSRRSPGLRSRFCPPPLFLKKTTSTLEQ